MFQQWSPVNETAGNSSVSPSVMYVRGSVLEQHGMESEQHHELKMKMYYCLTTFSSNAFCDRAPPGKYYRHAYFGHKQYCYNAVFLSEGRGHRCGT
ncbi:jg21940 [Pararge aegeria aegeria]|uniref:Jg21940 protein n=1 Tax=Pararge aegeria aegeria TaxID=348720 RepID=A0A8S4SF86_9NEOP|nr:jg21940 [Pararge aegeria aegeria]